VASPLAPKEEGKLSRGIKRPWRKRDKKRLKKVDCSGASSKKKGGRRESKLPVDGLY